MGLRHREGAVERPDQRVALGVPGDRAGQGRHLPQLAQLALRVGERLRLLLPAHLPVVEELLRLLLVDLPQLLLEAVDVVLVGQPGEVLLLRHQHPLRAGDLLLQRVGEPLQGGGDGEGRGAEDLPVDQGEQGAAGRLDRGQVLAAEVLADPVVQLLLLERRAEVLDDRAASRVAHVLPHLSAEGALHHRREPLLQVLHRLLALGEDLLLVGRAGRRGRLYQRAVEGAEGVLGTEHGLVEEAGQPEQLEEIVLERGGGEEELGPVAEGGAYRLAGLVERLVAVAESVGLVDHHQVPGDPRDQRRPVGRERHRADDRHREIEGVLLARGLGGGAVQALADQAELLPHLVPPLRPERRRDEDEDAALPLRHQLGDHHPRFDGLAEAHLVGEDAAAVGDRLEGEGRRLELVRVQVDLGLGEGRGDAGQVVARAAEGQLLGEDALVERTGRGHRRVEAAGGRGVGRVVAGFQQTADSFGDRRNGPKARREASDYHGRAARRKAPRCEAGRPPPGRAGNPSRRGDGTEPVPGRAAVETRAGCGQRHAVAATARLHGWRRPGGRGIVPGGPFQRHWRTLPGRSACR